MKLHLTYEFDSEDEMRAHLGAVAAPTLAPIDAKQGEPVATPEPTPVDEGDDEITRDSLDADGMPYDEAVHSDPPQFTAKGLWRAQRGKADEANAARDAFKAGGGNVEAPETPAPSASLPGMPGVAAIPAAPEPISLDRLIEKITGMLQRGSVKETALPAIYEAATGVSAADSFGVFETNETARANAYSALADIEPDMS